MVCITYYILSTQVYVVIYVDIYFENLFSASVNKNLWEVVLHQRQLLQLFQSKQALEYHRIKKHSKSTRQETCKVCQKMFATKVSLENHTRYVHSDKRKYSCQDCDSKFKEKKSLRNHYLYVHGIDQYTEKYQHTEEIKRFQCNECKRSYQRKKDLNHHKRSKHGSGESEQIFFCELCNTSFKQKKILNVHMKGKHGPNETFDCPKCGKAFNRKDNMKKHLYRHKFD